MSTVATTEKSVKKIIGKECRFATYVEPPSYDRADLHAVKEIVYFDDGTQEPRLNLIYDFHRPGWVTKVGRRDHKQKKEWTSQDNLIKVNVPQRKLVDACAKALGMPWFKGDLRQLSESPYLYGTDIQSTAVLKKAYQEKYKDIRPSIFSVAELDIETETVDEATFGQTVMCSISMGNRCFTAVRKHIFEGIADPHGNLALATHKHLSERLAGREMNYELVIVETDYDVWKAILDIAHAWMPDFLSIWNMDFEITNVLQMCERLGINPAHLFSDPSVPEDYKYFYYKRGKDRKVMASGKEMPIKPAAQWHTVFTPASFYIIDQMCSYKQVRTGEPEEQSYALDYLLAKNKIPAKFKYEAADRYQGLAWFTYMQANHPIEYTVYNRWDCLGPQTLDEKLKDLSVSIPSLAGTSDFQHIRSQPRRLVDDLHWECLEAGLVIGTTGKTLVDEFDQLTLSREDWITMLPAGILAAEGINVIYENPALRASVFVAVADLDVSAAYPNGGAAYNMSKETCSKEIISIDGVPEEVFRLQNMGLTAGHVNAVEWCTHMLNFPEIEELSDAWDQEMTQTNSSAYAVAA